MKRWFVVFSFISMLCTGALVYAKGPEVDLVDNKLSINADGITLSRLLQLVDLATGMKSKVPPELANRNISVQFSGLTLADGVRKIFQGQPFDYIMVQGRGIIVTAASQTAAAGELHRPRTHHRPCSHSTSHSFRIFRRGRYRRLNSCSSCSSCSLSRSNNSNRWCRRPLDQFQIPARSNLNR